MLFRCRVFGHKWNHNHAYIAFRKADNVQVSSRVCNRCAQFQVFIPNTFVGGAWKDVEKCPEFKQSHYDDYLREKYLREQIESLQKSTESIKSFVAEAQKIKYRSIDD